MVYMRKIKRILSLVLCLLILVGTFPINAVATDELPPTEAEICSHSGGAASCTTQAVCDSCGEGYGELAAHSYAEGICSVCQSADPEYVAPCEHTGGTSTCMAQAVCEKCGESYGELAAHSYAEGICSVCQSADPEYVAPCEHTGGTASCTSQAVCETCGENYGDTLAHSYGEDHKCTVCSALDPTAEPEVQPSETPTCICEDKCALNGVLSECAVCVEDYTVCTGEEKTISAEELEALAELFRKLPDASIFDYYVSPEEMDRISTDLETALTAFNALWEDNSDGALLFEEQYADLVLNAFALESVILDYDPANYAEGGYDISYNSSNSKFTITLDAGMDDAAPQVIRFDNGDPITYEVVKTGNRRYSFADNTNSGNYIITGSAAGHADQQISVSTRNSSATLSVKTHSGSTHVLMFYIYSNNVPQPYNGASTDNAHYGPSGNGTPMLRLEVNLAALSRMEDVVYNGSAWYFIPKYNDDGSVSTENVRAFWNAVLACSTESGRQALRDTGLYDIFKGYMIKTEWDGPHADGILDVTKLPIYVAELYDDNRYFGSVMGNDGEPKNLVDVLALCDQNLGGTVYWEKQSLAESIGYYYGSNNNVIKVTVTPMDNGTVRPTGSDIAYVKKSDQHFLARFKMVKENVSDQFYFDVTYADGVNDEEVFSTVTYPVRKGQAIPAYNGNPSREGYSFDSWKCVTEGYTNLKPGNVMPEKDIVFEAQWQINKYTVTWKNSDGTVLETDTDVEYGTMPHYGGETPTQADNAQYSYAFKGWTPAIDYVSADVVYTAIYEAFEKDYTVTWCDDNGTVLETDHHVPYGTMPSYDGTTPYKPNTAEHSYAFTGWSPEVSAVTGNASYTATYSETVNTYTVRWLDDDGTVLETDENVPYGTTPSYDSANPSKAATAEYTYTFTGWTPSIAAITGDTDYRATYSQTKNTYTVTWLNHDGSTLDTDSVPYGETPAYSGAVPTKEGNAQYSYTFTGWTPTISPVHGNQTYTAVFSETVNRYTVTWKYALNKEEIDSDLPYGTNLSFSDSANLNYEAGNYNYIFTGWRIDQRELVYTQDDVNAMTVAADMTLTAQYRAELKGHTVKVNVLLDGKPESINTVLGQGVTLYLYGLGGMPIALNADTDTATGSYSAELVPNGQYRIYSSLDEVTPLSQYELLVDGADVERNLYFYSVTYNLNGGSIEGNTANVVQYHRGAVTVNVPTPEKTGSTFLGWQLDDALYKSGDVLTDAIRQPYTLTALWGDAQVNLKIIMYPEYRNSSGTYIGEDPSDKVNIGIELTYRPAGATDEQEPYVEVVGADDKTAEITYSKEKTRTELTITELYTGLDNRYDYSANVFAPGYEVVSREVDFNEENNVYTVTVELQYRPHMFNLGYTVQMADGTASELIPRATDVKVISYVNEQWGPISAHRTSAHDLPFGDNATATGSYLVPVHDANENTYYYRVAAVGFTLKDGTELTNDYTLDAKNTWTFSSKANGSYPAGAYTAELQFIPDGDNTGAYGTSTETAVQAVQKGSLTLLVTAHPETIVLHHNDNTTADGRIENVFSIPALPVPEARTGYTFKGWYLDEGCTEPATVGTLLNISDNEDTHLYAKWNADITVSGTVYVSDIYTFGGKSYKISPDARLSHVTVRVMNDQGLPLKSVSAQLSYTNGKDYGEASYEIKGIADDGTEYTLSVLQAVGSNYSGVYQNEPESLSAPTTFESYTAEDNIVLTGTADPLIATVNAYLSFTPHTFDLEYSIDASAIGETFRPDTSRTLIYADEATNETMSWAVITQMLEGGQQNNLSSGKGSWSYPVWQAHADGSLYNYAVRLQELSYCPMGDDNAVTISDFGAQLPFAVTYEPLYTYYVAASSAQKDELTITLSPKTYPIEYVTNGGTMPENYAAEHKWSFETALNAVPEREGYSFQGWYTDASFQAASAIESIPASVAEKTTVYAKWQPISYRIDYFLGGGTAEGNPNSYTVESDTIVLNAPSREGYTFIGWTGTNETSYNKLVTIPKGSTGDLMFTAHWEQSKYTITTTVENGSASANEVVTVTHGDTLTISFTANSGFALDSVTVDGKAAYLENGKYTFANITDHHSIHVIYSADNNTDGKPDKYQASVTYNVVNGSLAAGVESEYVFDLKTYTNGLWVEAEPKLGDTLPTVANGRLLAAEGYNGIGYWWENISADTPVTGDASYTWEFTGRLLHTVTFPDADRAPTASGIYPDSITNNILYGSMIRVDPNGGSWTSTITGNTETYTSSYDFPLQENIHLGTPSRENYVFCGWRDSVGEGNIAHVYTAQWAPEVYTITYVMPNSFLETPNPNKYTVETESFTLNNPHRPGYVFDGWSGSGIDGKSDAVTIAKGSSGHRTYIANWTANTDTPYQVRYYFQNLELDGYEEQENLRRNLVGTTDSTVSVDIPTDEPEGFKFNKERSYLSSALYGDGSLVLYLVYDRNTYTVNWQIGDQIEETDEKVPYSAMPQYNGTVPTKEATDQYTYAFSGWAPEVVAVTKDITYEAQFTSTVKQYTVTWLDYDNQILRKDTLNYGDMPKYCRDSSDSDPTRESSALFHYIFTGWDTEPVIVTADAQYKAQYHAEPRLYTGTVRFFVDGDDATADQMAGSLSGEKTLWLKTDAGNEYHPLTLVSGSSNQYSAQIPVGNYRVYLKDGENYISLSDGYLSIIDQPASVDIHYYTVTYNPGYTEGSINVDYYLKGSAVNVGPELSREGYGFYGWQLGNALYQKDDVLTDGIRQSYTLTALWGDAKVNLKVILNHKYLDKGTDPASNINLDIELTYRPAGVIDEQEPYVEVVGAESKTKNVEYSSDKIRTEVNFTDLYMGLDNRYDYSANVFVPGYEVVSRKVENVDNVYTVTVELQYRPHMFDLEYTVQMADGTASELIPSATDVKVISYVNEQWGPISAHKNSAHDLPFGNDTTATGSYPVPVHDANEKTYYYKVAAVGFTLKDGTELNNSYTLDADGAWTFSSIANGRYPAGAYTAELVFEPDGNDTGAYGTNTVPSVQKGTLTLNVNAHPASLTLDLNYTGAPAYKTIENIFAVSNLSQYVPERTGFTFLGWYTDATCETQALSGTVLEADSDVTYYAKWAENLTIAGSVEASNYYDGKLLVKGDRLTSLVITLHKNDNSRAQVGLPQTIILADGTDANTGNYRFENVPNDGSEYYIAVSALGYEALFQNELSNEFTATANIAVDAIGDSIAHVNVKLSFAPEYFDLHWKVDASKLGENFRPKNAPVFIMGDTEHGEGYKWEVITQMRTEDDVENPASAATTIIGDDGTNNSYEVWKFSPHGHAYNYAIRIASMDVDLNGNGTIEDSEKLAAASNENYRDKYANLPFRVQYVYPAYYKLSTEKQDTLLTATLIPNTYTVTLDPNGGKLSMKDGAVNPITHTWSHETTAQFTLSRSGYVFEGWADKDDKIVNYADADSITVAASLAENVKLTAKWTAISSLSFTAKDVFGEYTGSVQGGGNELITTDLPEGHTFEGVTYSVEGTNVGEYQGEFTATNIRIKNGDKDVTHYFDVEHAKFNPGVLVISPTLVTVTAKDISKDYDGQAVSEFEYTVDGIVNNEDIGLAVSFTGNAVNATDVGSYTITPSVTITNNNYYTAVKSGTLEIKPKTITASIVAKDRPYDQNNIAQADITLNGVVEGDSVSVQAESIRFESANVARDANGEVTQQPVTAYGVTLYGADKNNYQLEPASSVTGYARSITDSASINLTGNARITPLPLELKLFPVNREYNGSKEVAVTAGNVAPLPGDIVLVHNCPTVTTMENANVGDNKPVTISDEALSAIELVGDNAVNYDLTYTVSTVDITPRKVTLRSASAEKPYDGDPLTAPEVYIEEGSFVAGEVSNIRAEASLIGNPNTDSSVTNAPIYFDKAEGVYIDNNYSITEIHGTLTVRADKNGNKIPDDLEVPYTVTYLASAEHTNLEQNIVHSGLLIGMQIPGAPDVTADTGYKLGSWTLISGTEGANGTISTTDLVYELTVDTEVYPITYILEEGAVNDAANPASYTYGVGVDSFAPAVWEAHVFMGWFSDPGHVHSITEVSTASTGELTLYPKWMEDADKDGIPDEYQRTVTYRVVNGTWADDTARDKSYVFNLHELKDGKWEEVTPTLGTTIPTGMKPSEAYKAESGKWNEEIAANTEVSANACYTYSFGEKHTYTVTVTVTGGTAKCGEADYVAPITVEHGDEPTFTFTADSGKILDLAQIRAAGSETWTDIALTDGSYTLDAVTEDIQINVRFSPDQWNDEEDVLDNPDRIPDTRQAVFVFRSEDNNGTVSGKTTQVVTIEKDSAGHYVASVTPETVTVQAAQGYKLKNWTRDDTECDPFAAIQAQGGSSYVFTAHFEVDNKTVAFLNAEVLVEQEPQPDSVSVQSHKKVIVNPNGGIWRNSSDVQVLSITADEDLLIPTRSGHLFVGWLCEAVSEDDIVYSFTAQWLTDAQEDGIPDKYQKKVTFSIVNGVWGYRWLRANDEYAGTDDDIIVYLTLTDADGKLSETGTADLEPYIPTRMQANSGFYKGSWDVEPPETVTGNDSVNYTYRYQLKPYTGPKTGDDFDMGMWAGLMSLSFAGILALGYPLMNNRKKRSK